MYYMLCLDNQVAKKKIQSLPISNIAIDNWLRCHESVRAIFYQGAVALLEKIPEGWVLSYMYTIPECRGRGDMTHLLKILTKQYILFAVPVDSRAERLLKKTGFALENSIYKYTNKCLPLNPPLL